MASHPAALTKSPAGRLDEIDRLRLLGDELQNLIGKDVHELGYRVRRTFDVRRQVSRHPLLAAAVVAGGALLLAWVVRPRRVTGRIRSGAGRRAR